MKKSITLFVALMIAIATTTFAMSDKNSMVSENRAHVTFYGVVIASDINVVLSQDASQSVRVEAEKSDLPYINTKVINGSLLVSVRHNHRLNGFVNVYITMNEINMVEVIGDGSVRSTDMINADILTLKVKGNGSINLDVRALTVGMNLNGCGSINIAGTAASSIIKISGPGHINTKNFSAFSSVEIIDGVPVGTAALKS